MGIGQWLSVGGTWAAVLVALFKNEIIGWWRRPKLELTAGLEPPHCHIMPIHREIQLTAPTIIYSTCYYLRLWIENSGKTRAEKAQVFMSKVLEKGEDGKFKEKTDFIPVNLLWSHGQTVAGGREVFAEGISPKMGKHCDLGHVINPEQRKYFGEDLPAFALKSTIFGLALEVCPSTLSHLLIPGTYQFELRIAAANCSPVVKKLELTVTGNWYDDPQTMCRKGIHLRVIS
jgi:hypothetical protein